MAHFSPRSWLHSLYSHSSNTLTQNKGKSPTQSLKEGKGVGSGRSTEHLRKIYTSRLRENQSSSRLKEKSPATVNDKAVFKNFNGRVSEQLFRRSDSEKLFPTRLTEVQRENRGIIQQKINEYQQGLVQKDKLTRKVRINPEFPQVAQIVLTESNTSSTPQFRPRRESRETLFVEPPGQNRVKPDGEPLLPMLLRKPKPNIENLEIIKEETLEQVKANSTFRTPREVQDQLLISIVEKTVVQSLEEQPQLETEEQEEAELETEEEQLLQDSLDASPVKNYQCSASIPIYESLEKSQSQNAGFPELKELYLQQFEKEENSRNLTASLSRELEAGVVFKGRMVTFENQPTTSLDRLSPIPLEDSRRQEKCYQSIHSCTSATREQHQESAFKLIRVERLVDSQTFVIGSENSEAEQFKVIKKLRIYRKPEATPLTKSREIRKQGIHTFEPRATEPPLFNYCSLRTVGAQPLNEFPTPSQRTSAQYMSGRFTDRERKGISLSKKSEEKIAKRSLQKPPSNFAKPDPKLNKLKTQDKRREFVRLGNKITITLVEEKKGGIRVVSEERQRSKSKSIRKKIM